MNVPQNVPHILEAPFDHLQHLLTMPNPEDARANLLAELREGMFENAFDDAGRLRVVILQPSTPPSTDPATCELQSWLPPQPPPSSKD
jgi:hypothetical protein